MRGSVLWVALGVAASLAACTRQPIPPGAAKSPATQAAALWSVQVDDASGKPGKLLLVCADQAVRDTFVKPMPSPDGKACTLLSPPVVTADRYSARCKSGSRHFSIEAIRTGDLAKAFTVALMIRSDVPGQPEVSQALHYRQVGACPSEWSPGDSAGPGDRRVVNTVSGVARSLQAPAPNPKG